MSANTLQLPARSLGLGQRLMIFVMGALAGAFAVLYAAVFYAVTH